MRGPLHRTTARARALRRASTDTERRLWLRLANRQLAGHKFVRQEPVGPYIADFICRAKMLVVELDGSQHIACDRDRVRDAFLRDRGYRVLRFWNEEVRSNVDGILETILAALEARI